MVDIFQEDLFSASTLVMLCVRVYDVLSSFVACCKVPLLNLLQKLHDGQASLLDLEQQDPLPRAHSKYHFAIWAMQEKLVEIVNKMSHLLFYLYLNQFQQIQPPFGAAWWVPTQSCTAVLCCFPASPLIERKLQVWSTETSALIQILQL